MITSRIKDIVQCVALDDYATAGIREPSTPAVYRRWLGRFGRATPWTFASPFAVANLFRVAIHERAELPVPVLVLPDNGHALYNPSSQLNAWWAVAGAVLWQQSALVSDRHPYTEGDIYALGLEFISPAALTGQCATELNIPNDLRYIHALRQQSAETAASGARRMV
jgi:hypothetical protein